VTAHTDDRVVSEALIEAFERDGFVGDLPPVPPT
jgi:hypothetical protein